MTVYLLLIAYIVLCPLILNNLINDEIKRKQKVCAFSMFGIFLVLALKAPSVGRDIAGYKIMYETLANRSWDNFANLYWTEYGFEVLEMFFSHVLKFSFQGFVASIYAFVCFQYYKFLIKYSEDITLSCLIYVCFGYMTFDISGIRNMLSTAIILMAIPFTQSNNKKDIIKYFVLVLISTQIHRSGYIGILLYYFAHFKLNHFRRVIYCILPVIAALLIPLSNRFLSNYSRFSIEEGVILGGNLILYLLTLLYAFYVYHKLLFQYENNENEALGYDDNHFQRYEMILRVFYFGVLLTALLSANIYVRLASVGLFFFIILIPSILTTFEYNGKILAKFVIVIFLIAYFYIFKLSTNELDMLPYTFYWSY